MAVFNATKPGFKNPHERPFRSQENLQTSTLFNKETPLDNIVGQIKGGKWNVDYFLQLRDVNDKTTQLDLNVPVTIQKYHRVNNLTLYLQSAIQQEALENLSGEAVVNAGFLPNVNDLFMAEVIGGRIALFKIENINSRSYNLHKSYYLEFKLYCFIEDNEEVYNNLVKKTVKEYVYDPGHLLDYSAPVILKEDYKRKIELKSAIPELVTHYLKKFTHHRKPVISIPANTIYTDVYLTNFLFKIIDVTTTPMLQRLSRVEPVEMLDRDYTIWDVLLNRDITLLKHVKRYIGFKYVSAGGRRFSYAFINNMGINFFAVPVDELEDVIEPEHEEFNPDADRKRTILSNMSAYVLSSEFYDYQRDAITEFEEMVFMYLEGKVLDSKVLEKYLNEYRYWTTMEQFYLIPILILLVKDAINNTYSAI